MAIKIRTVTYDDIVKIADFRMKFLFEVSGNEMTSTFREETIEYLKRNINTNSVMCYLAIEEDKIISTVILCIYDVIPKELNDTGKVGYIFSVYTLKEYRGQGLAKNLMRRTIEVAKERGVKEIFLNAEEKAVPLYNSLGFEFVDREMVLNITSETTKVI